MWGKEGRCVSWQTYHLHVTTTLKSGSLILLEPSGPVQACNGTAFISRRRTSNHMVSEGLETHSNSALAKQFSLKFLLTLSASRGKMQRRWVSETESRLFVCGRPSLIIVLASYSGGTARHLSRTIAKGTKECIVRFALMFHKASSDSDISLCSCNEKSLVKWVQLWNIIHIAFQSSFPEIQQWRRNAG